MRKEKLTERSFILVYKKKKGKIKNLNVKNLYEHIAATKTTLYL